MSKESYGTITLTDIEDANLLGGHFIYNSDGAGVIQNIGNGPSNWGYNTWIGSTGIQLRDAATPYATLNANGLTLSKGGIKAKLDSNDKVYLSSENYGSNLTINNHTASDWREVIGSNFGIDAAGNLYASNAVIYGSIYASKGYIGGWQIGTDGNKTLHNGNADTSPTIGNNTIILSKGLTSTTSIAGSTGQQTWTIAVDTSFGVTTAGKLYANNARISGVIDVLAGGTIGAFTLDNDYIQSTKDGYNMGIGNTTNWAFWAGWQAGVGAPFQVKQDGSLIATSANITGEITASKLTIASGAQVSGVAVPSDVDNASYSVEIKVTAINYTGNTATLVAVPYYQGGSIPSGVAITYQWYKDNVSDSNPDNRVGTGSSLSVTNTSAMGLDHNYICVISK